MFDKWMKYSYAAQKHERHRLLRVFLVVLGLYVAYHSINVFFISTWTLQSNTMQPGLRSGERFFVTSAVLPSMIASIRRSDHSVPFKRGHIVLVDTGLPGRKKLLPAFIDDLVRFFTAQRISLFGNEEHLYVKRLIGLPGDEVSMTNFVLRVRPADSVYTFTEFELSDKPYYPNIPQIPALWDASLPLSGNMEPLVLGDNECFVISDDRGSSGDSRTWGPVASGDIIGRVVFRFWPLARIGAP